MNASGIGFERVWLDSLQFRMGASRWGLGGRIRTAPRFYVRSLALVARMQCSCTVSNRHADPIQVPAPGS